MKITTVTYSKKFPYAPYLNIDIGFEATLDSDGCDDPLQAIGQLAAMAEQYFNEKYQQSEPTYTPQEKEFISQHIEPQLIKISPQDEENNLITSIESAKNEQELIQYKLLAAKNQKSMGAYNKRRKQLNLE